MVTMEDIKVRYPDAVSFKFGDSAELCAELNDLVRAGEKTATCGPTRLYDRKPEEHPVVGRRDVALDWNGQPALLIETLELSTCRFQDVREDFALAEGENDDLEGWRRDHSAYFERNGGYSPDMMVICERFRLVEDLQPED